MFEGSTLGAVDEHVTSWALRGFVRLRTISLGIGAKGPG